VGFLLGVGSFKLLSLAPCRYTGSYIIVIRGSML
jgi:hypothetical protein